MARYQSPGRELDVQSRHLLRRGEVGLNRVGTMAFVASLRQDRMETPWLVDVLINGQGFRTYVEKALSPPSDGAIWWSWTTSAVTKARPFAAPSVQPAQSWSSSPSNSPDLNPSFAKLKGRVRKAAPRTLESDAIATALAQISRTSAQTISKMQAALPSECRPLVL